MPALRTGLLLVAGLFLAQHLTTTGARHASRPPVYANTAGGGCVPGATIGVPTSGYGLLNTLTPATVAAGVHPYAVTVSPDGRSVYVADYGSESVSQYARNPATGALTHLSPATVAAGVEPHSVAVSADGESVYVANAGSDSVSQYARNRTSGVLRALSPATVETGATPRSIALSPDGQNAYVANTGAEESSEEAVSQYRRDPKTGELSALSPSTVQGGLNPRFVTVSADGKNVYVGAYGSKAVFGFTRNPATGTLTNRVVYPLEARPYSIAVSQDGRNVYVADYSTGGVSQFARNPANGLLKELNPFMVAAGEETHSVVVSPDGANVYATNATPVGTISQYTRNSKTGVLSAAAPGEIEAGTEPTALALDPSGQSVYVTNHRSTSISQYARTADGQSSGLLLTSLLVRDSHVQLEGLATPSLIGRRVTIALDGRRSVGGAQVGANARFKTILALPRSHTGALNLNARYRVQVGSLRSSEATLARRLNLTAPTSTHGRVTLRGRVVPPFTAPAAPVQVLRRVGCARAVTVASTKPNVRGYYTLTLPLPIGGQTAVYQTTTTVGATGDSRRRVQTTSLEEPVSLK